MGTWSGSQKQVRPFHLGAQKSTSQATEHTESRMQFGNKGGQGHDGRRKRVELVVPIFSNKNSEYDSKTSGIKPRYKHKTRSGSGRRGTGFLKGFQDLSTEFASSGLPFLP